MCWLMSVFVQGLARQSPAPTSAAQLRDHHSCVCRQHCPAAQELVFPRGTRGIALREPHPLHEDSDAADEVVLPQGHSSLSKGSKCFL